MFELFCSGNQLLIYIFLIVNGKQNRFDYFGGKNIFGWKTISVIFFYYPFTKNLFNNIIFFRFGFNVFVVFFIFMFMIQISCTTISITLRIIRFTCLIISTTNVVLLIFIWWERFFIMFFSSMLLSTFDFLLGLSGSWVLSFPVIKISEIYFFYSCEG